MLLQVKYGFQSFIARVLLYACSINDPNPYIGCLCLFTSVSSPFFFFFLTLIWSMILTCKFGTCALTVLQFYIFFDSHLSVSFTHKYTCHTPVLVLPIHWVLGLPIFLWHCKWCKYTCHTWVLVLPIYWVRGIPIFLRHDLFKHLMHPLSIHLFHTWVLKPTNVGASRSKLSNPISYITYSPVVRLLGGHSPNASCKNEQNHTDIWSFSITKYRSTLTLMKSL